MNVEKDAEAAGPARASAGGKRNVSVGVSCMVCVLAECAVGLYYEQSERAALAKWLPGQRSLLDGIAGLTAVNQSDILYYTSTSG